MACQLLTGPALPRPTQSLSHILGQPWKGFDFPDPLALMSRTTLLSLYGHGPVYPAPSLSFPPVTWDETSGLKALTVVLSRTGH